MKNAISTIQIEFSLITPYNDKLASLSSQQNRDKGLSESTEGRFYDSFIEPISKQKSPERYEPGIRNRTKTIY